jgi:hypothetical protein
LVSRVEGSWSLFDCEVTNVYRVLSENDPAPSEDKFERLARVRIGQMTDRDISGAGELFSSFGACDSIKWTGASKALHVRVRETFVMWEKDIRTGYHLLHGSHNTSRIQSSGHTRSRLRSQTKCQGDFALALFATTQDGRRADTHAVPSVLTQQDHMSTSIRSNLIQGPRTLRVRVPLGWAHQDHGSLRTLLRVLRLMSDE